MCLVGVNDCEYEHYKVVNMWCPQRDVLKMHKVKDMDTYFQTSVSNIITWWKKESRFRKKTFWIDHTSYFHRLRTASLRGHEMSCGNTRPDCNLKHFAVHLSEWKRNKGNHFWVFIYLHKCIFMFCFYRQFFLTWFSQKNKIKRFPFLTKVY